MIQAFVGLVGGGKSFCSVRRMCSYMASGGRCASNILLAGWDDSIGDLSSDSPVIKYLSSLGWRYQPKQYVYISYDDMTSNPLWYTRIPAGISRDKRTLCVVDEATDLFDTLDGGKLRSDSTYRQLFHFLRLSRHAHIDVLFVCQDINSINSRLRSLVANVWRSTDMKHFKVGIFKFGFPFDVFMLQLFDRTGKFEIKREFVKKDLRIFGLYQSETFGGCLGVKWDGVAVSDGTIKKEVRKMSLPWKIAFILLAGLCAWLLWRDCSRGPVGYADYVAFSNAVDCVVIDRVVELASLNLRGDGGNHSPHYCPSNSVPLPSKDKAQASSRASVAPVKPKTQVAPSLPKTRYVRGLYEFGQAGNDVWVYFDGALVRRGCPSEFGTAVMIDKYFAACVNEDGLTTYLLPLDESRLPTGSRLPSPRFTSSGDGRRAPSWYYAHTGTDGGVDNARD